MNGCTHTFFDGNTGCCTTCGTKVHETAVDRRITDLEKTVATLMERIAKMEAASRRTLL